MGTLKAGRGALLLALIAIPAHAQDADTAAANHVNVSISDLQILNDLAGTLDVEVSQIPVTVQVTVHVATDVCGVSQDVLERDDPTHPTNCDATTISPAFRDAVERQLFKH